MNEYKRQALEERLQILDILEGLITRAPNRELYNERLADFGLNITVDSMQAHIDYLGQNGIATFIVPQGSTQWTFWDLPVRIRNINPAKLCDMQKSLRDELGSMIDGALKDNALETANKRETQRQKTPDSGSVQPPSSIGIFAAIIGVITGLVGVVSVIFTWNVLRTDFARTLVCVSLVLFVAMLSRIVYRWRANRLPLGVVSDVILAASLAACITLMFTVILFRPISEFRSRRS